MTLLQRIVLAVILFRVPTNFGDDWWGLVRALLDIAVAIALVFNFRTRKELKAERAAK